ncbi:nucleotide exchange factor GrpE [Nocardia flavorosea]|uniref:nucleotide exchange factor GrpE n=1 Tax=Nocardia flavorosea TaxID=53429 RepID=UPI001893720B|nr:nucleotide exchange factor GrpE [Nocardia flavorosea]MBF6350401.1 nucleotide exchange factor GrpE [Nocardia flavorosea]
MTNADNNSEEPISFVDKRKIDPETGEVRDPAGAADEATPAGDGTATGADEGVAPQAPQSGLDGDGAAAAATASDPASELAERTADLQRLTAEYTNYRRRVERDRKTAIDTAKAAVVTELLGVLDDLDRAKAHGDLEAGPLRSVADKLTEALRKQGLEEFGAEGDAFDPNLHEAVQHEGTGHDPVLGVVMRKGYRFGERVLRHAMVGVTDGVGDTAADTTADAAPAAEAAAAEASDADAGSSN